MPLKTHLFIATAIAASLTLAACEDASDKADYDAAPAAAETEMAVEAEMPAAEPMMEDAAPEVGTIVEVAAGTDDLSTLVAALTAASLVDTLNSDGPFTVFAPPNSAFAKLPDGTVETLLMPENKETLSAVLTYHVVAGEVMAADLVQAITDNGGTYTITTVNGAALTASIVDGNVVLTDATGATATVTATDIDASNGVVHLIDSVVMPG
ncbi:fasciclin domain-containing protein [Hyphomonas oceanitis]|uniref:fasciclin domain-containing protein n=1 Tax=Hyphomonas oceanitis TaxID=81033 RepID=UPI0030038807